MRTSKLIVKALAAFTVIVSTATAQDFSWYNPDKDTSYISTEGHLQALSSLVNSGHNFDGKTIIMTADIYLSENHIPIGNNTADTRRFLGTFDGNGHSISNLSIHQSSGYAGLFGYVGNNGQIKNIVVNVSIIRLSSTAADDYNRVGGLAGYYASRKEIVNSGVNIKDSIFVASLTNSVGGLIGRAENITIRNSYMTGKIFVASASVSCVGFIGGLVGYSRTITIDSSYAIGNISGANINNSITSAGGLIGQSGWGSFSMGAFLDSATIKNSYAKINVFAGGGGGLIGQGEIINISNSYSTGNIRRGSRTVGAASIRSGSGGLIGRGARIEINNSYATGDVSGGDGYSGGLVGEGVEFSLDTDKFSKVIIDSSHATGNISGDFSSGGLIGTAKSIEISNSYSTSNVSKTGNNSNNHGYGGLVGGRNFRGEPVIKISNSYATGNIIGGYYNGGLIGSGRRVVVDNSHAKGKISGGNLSGGLVGQSDTATISNSYVSGDVSGNSVGGGLVGNGDSETTIIDSYVSGDISGGDFSGGLVGKGDLIIVNRSYVSGNVSSSNNSSTSGGLVGSGNFDINNSFASANVSSGSYSGGLVGRGDGNITNSYASGTITATGSGNRYNGGIFGIWQSGTNISVYYNSEGATWAGMGFPAGISGKTPNELRNQQTFIGWDFDEIWAINSEINNGFPYLRALGHGNNTSISNIKKSDNCYGIKFAQNIVSDKAEISVILPKNERAVETKIVIYDMTGNVVFSTTAWDNVSWDLRNAAGRFVANGTYLVIAEAKDRNGMLYMYSSRLGVRR